jgi:hypothetical protein
VFLGKVSEKVLVFCKADFFNQQITAANHNGASQTTVQE